MPVKLSSSGGGSVTLDTPSTASNYTVTLPAATSTLIDTTSTQTLTNKTLTAAGSNTVEATSGPTSSQLAGNRNKIINGAMMIDQRNAGASVTPAIDGIYVLDRFCLRLSAASKLSVQQKNALQSSASNYEANAAPSGFGFSTKITSLSSYSVSSTDYFSYEQDIEGTNFVDLDFGTSNAATFTLTFWVKSSLTGAFSGVVLNSARDRYFAFSYNINSANTWEQKTVTIAGDTAGTWLTDNNAGLILRISLGVGSTRAVSASTVWATTAAAIHGVTGTVSVVGTNGATFYITGVQLEKGATATPFENRLYGTELALCQRYYQQYFLNTATFAEIVLQGTSATNGQGSFTMPVTMRSAPTVSKSGTVYMQGGISSVSATLSAASPTIYSVSLSMTTGIAVTTNGGCASLYTNSANCGFTMAAEL